MNDKKKIRAVLAMGLAAMMLAGENASAWTVTSYTSNQPYTVSETDLLQCNVSSVDTNGLALYTESGMGLSCLTDGTTGTGNKDNAFGIASNSITFFLDTTKASSGYDITGFDSYSGWQDNGRVNQNYVASFRKLGASIFESAITNTYTTTLKELRVSVSDLNLTGIDAVKFTFLTQQNYGVGYKEFDLFGMPVTTNFSMTGVSGNTAFAVSSNDLLQTATATTNGTFTYYTSSSFTCAPFSALTDGSFGSADKTNGTCAITKGTLTYALDTTNTPAGYTLASLDSFTGWDDNGRDDQNYWVSFRKVGAPNFSDAIAVSYTGTVKLTHVTVTNLNLAHIEAVRFTFLTQENNGVGYKELDLSGAAPAYTEVTRRDSGSQAIASNDTANILISEGEGTPGALAVDSPTTIIDTLTHGATGDTAVIDAAGQTLALNGLFLKPDAAGLVFTNGTLMGTQSSLAIGNWSTQSAVLSAMVTNSTAAGLLLKTGSGSLTLCGTNTCPGGTEVSAGTLRLVSGASLGNGYVNIHDGALQIDGGVVYPVTGNSLRLCFINAALNQTAGSLTYGGNLQAQNTTLNLSGGTSYLGADALLGWGGTNTTAVFSGSHTADWKTTRLSSGTVALYLQNGGKLLTDRVYSYAGAAGSVYFDGGTLGVSIQSPTLYPSDWLGVQSGTLSLLVQNGGAILDTANGSVVIKRPFLRDSTSTGGLTKTGTNTLTLMITNANTFCTYAGDTTVSAGTLKLWPSTSPLPANTRLTVASGAFLDMNGATQTVGEVNGEGRIYNSFASNAVLTVGGDNASTNFAGIIDGAVSLVKTGTGTWALSGANSFTNNVRVTGGTLQLAPLPVAIVNAGFESPAMSTNNSGGGFSYLTSDGVSGGWTMSGNTGNNTGAGVAYSGYPTNAPWSITAPHGNQIGYLQGGSFMYQTVTVQRAGTYQIAFSAANRPRYLGANVFAYIDNSLVASWTNSVFASSGIFQSFSTNVSLAVGPHELRFVGTVATPGGDTTTTFDDIRLVSTGDSAWSTLPTGSVVTVDSGATLDLNGTYTLLSSLSGSGTVTNGTLALQGVIAPGGTNAIGTLTLAAAAQLNGTLLIDTASDGSCDRLQVQGPLDLSGLSLQVQDISTLKGETTYLIATCAPGGLTGRFISTNLNHRRAVAYDTVQGQVKLVCTGTIITLL